MRNRRQIFEDAFGNALGNAAIAGIEHENQVAEQKQLRASVDQLRATQSAELSASTDTFEAQTGAQAMANIRAAGQSKLDQKYAGTEQALEDRLAAMPDPSLAASIAAINADNQRIAALQASNNAYAADIQFVSPGEQEEAFNLFPSATYAAPTANGGGAVNGVLQWLAEGRIYSDIPAFANGAYQGIQKVPGEMEAAVANVWGDVKQGWAHVSSLNNLAGDALSLNNEIYRLPEQLSQLPGEVQNWATGFGNRMEQDGAQLFNYLRNTPDTQIAYDVGYGITSHAPMIALAIGTDGFGEVADGGDALWVARDVAAPNNVVDAGITWGRGIQGQGMPWENYLAGQLPDGSRLPPNFKTFDFYDLETGNAISAKTLDTTTASRSANPTRIYYSLKSNIDSALNFDTPYELDGFRLDPNSITSRELQVAVPPETTPVQWQQINRAIQYGQDNGVKVIVTPAH